MNEILRPLAITMLVLIEVGLWQWRTLLTAHGSVVLPTGLGMLGALLQITAIAQVVTNVHDPLTVAAYALGVGGGIAVGVIVGERLSPAAIGIRLTTADVGLDAALRCRGWPVTAHSGRDDTGPIQVLLIVVSEQCRVALLADIEELAPAASLTTQAFRPGPTPTGRKVTSIKCPTRRTRVRSSPS